jgi:transposase
MPINRVAPLVLPDEDREQLERMARSTSLPHRAVRQAKALAWAADGLPNAEIARRGGVDPDAVHAWRQRFEDKGVGGVGVIAKGRGRRPWLSDGPAAEVLRVTCQELPPDGATHWSIRALAEHLGVGKDTVARIWRNHELKPRKVDCFKISGDPRFEEKLVDVPTASVARR